MGKLTGFSSILGLGQFVLMITVLVVRFSHAVKVCSGDYLSDNELEKLKNDKRSKNSLPLEDGSFLFVISIFYIVGLSCCCLACCCACFGAVVGGAAFAGQEIQKADLVEA